jgi:hypothetical protein
VAELSALALMGEKDAIREGDARGEGFVDTETLTDAEVETLEVWRSEKTEDDEAVTNAPV